MKTWETKNHRIEPGSLQPVNSIHSAIRCSCGERYQITNGRHESIIEAHGRHILHVEGNRTHPLPDVAKRAAIEHTDFVPDWFRAASPRSDGAAEGPWEHHAKLALAILQHPLTALVMPDAFKAVQHLDQPENLDSDVRRPLTEAEIRQFVPENELEF